MTTDALVGSRGRGLKTTEYQAIGLVSSAHFVNHFQNLVLPPLFPFLKAQLGIDFVELGFALTLSNLLSVVAQLPVGFLVDRFGSRRMLVVALIISGLAFIGFGMAPSYWNLLLAMTVFGVCNSVFHPADYAILSTQIAPVRLGRAFSIHTFAGFLGTAVAPMTMLAIVASGGGLRPGLIAAGILGLVVAVPLAMARGVDNLIARPVGRSDAPAPRVGLSAILTPSILALTGFFALLSLSGSGISNFSVVALTSAFGTPLSVANLALTAYLAAQAFGVLAGGFVADMTRRHAEIAAIGYAINACVVLAIGTLGLSTAPLLAAMAAAGLLGGMIMPSRDMLVRAAAPPGAVGRTFGVVTTGFNIAGTIGPLLFGYIMDRGAPEWVFGGSVIIMAATALLAWVGERRSTARRRRVAVLAAE
ncbi:MAG TPA: MFS transporter [Stellaceae bacterium]|jgi:MFS family permease|nr:MFS transporter [Stellaceae bacterium]